MLRPSGRLARTLTRCLPERSVSRRGTLSCATMTPLPFKNFWQHPPCVPNLLMRDMLPHHSWRALNYVYLAQGSCRKYLHDV